MITGNCRGSVALALSFLMPFAGSAPALTRVPNTTIHVPLQPQANGFAIEDAFGSVTFSRPVALTTPPGETNRVFVLEQSGVVSVITNLASPNRTVFMDLTDRVISGSSFTEHGLLGLAFHPQYASNGWLYVFYTGNTTTAAGTGLHDIVARFQTIPGNPNQGDPASEVRLIIQRDEADNHNGGCLKFGPDGYLYVSLGDEGGANDQFGNSQKIDADFFSGILRIDVDKRPGSLAPNPHAASTTNYTVPPDNPFVGATNFNGSAVNPGSVRTEFWAVGLRNPWRMSFDPATGLLYVGDVGQSSREEVDVITKGGNYGWGYREGTIQRPGSPVPPAGFQGIEPLLDYQWGFSGDYQGRAVTGGVVYRGTKIASLYGAYIFGDNATGNIWSLRHQGTNVTAWTRLTGVANPTAFGTDPRNGDVLIAPLTTGRLQRLVPTSSTGDPPPATLEDTGVFSQLETLTPNAGVVPYELNLAFWSDNAIKRRWFSVPDTNRLLTFTRDANWSFPTGTVWIKHFELELTNGVPASRQRLETRLLVKNDDGVHGFTYRWGTSTSNALLVTEAGLDEAFVVDDGGGLLRTQVWHYPSRSECLACHTAAGGFGLGFNTAQLNRSANMGAGVENQVHALSEAGYFTETVSNLYLLPAMPSLTNADVSLEHRVRAYLAANCVSCHSPGGPAPAQWDARFATPTSLAGIIDGPLVNNGGSLSNRVIARASTALSQALQRISTRGPGQMPPLSSTVVDTQAVALLSAWITNDLPAYQTFAEWQVTHFGATNAWGAGPEEDYDGDLDVAYLEYLNDTNPRLASSRWRLSHLTFSPMFYVLFHRIANRGYELEFTPDVGNPNAWTPLDSPWNSPAFSSGDAPWFVPDTIHSDEESRLYRVRVYER